MKGILDYERSRDTRPSVTVEGLLQSMVVVGVASLVIHALYRWMNPTDTRACVWVSFEFAALTGWSGWCGCFWRRRNSAWVEAGLLLLGFLTLLHLFLLPMYS